MIVHVVIHPGAMPFFYEFCMGLVDSFNSLGVNSILEQPVSLPLSNVTKGDVVIVCAAHCFPTFKNPRNGVKYLFYQGEQIPILGQPEAFQSNARLTEINRYINEYDGVIENHEEGSKFFKSIGKEPVGIIPVGYHERFELKETVVPTYDAIFFGADSERRVKIIQGLRSNGVKVLTGTMFGAYRIRCLLSAKVVLNLHYDTINTFEQARFMLGMANKRLVLSETLVNMQPYQNNVHMVVVPYNDICATCIELIKNDEERKRIETEAYNFITTKGRLIDYVKNVLSNILS